MKRILTFLLVLSLIAGCCVVAFAAGKPVITQQPEVTAGKSKNSVVISVNAKSFESLTWYFVNPATGEKTSGRNISKVFSGLKVSNPNGRKITLKKVPAEMNGWGVYAHFFGNGYKVDSEMITLQIGDGTVSATSAGAAVVAPAGVSAPASGPYTVSTTGFELYKVDASGEPTGEAATSLTFEGAAAVCVMAPEGKQINNLLINSLTFTPSTAVNSLTLNGIVGPTVISGSVVDENGEVIDLSYNISEPAATEEPTEEPVEETKSSKKDSKKESKKAAKDEPTPTPNIADLEPGVAINDELFSVEVVTPAPVNTPEPQVEVEDGVTVTCENCRFSGGGYTFATSGTVPAGTQIVVISGATGNLNKGYVINGAAADYKGKSSFRLTVDQNTTITMEARK